MEAASIDLAGVTKRYGAHVVLDRLSLSIEPGEFFTLLGPSGCGKTTILRIVAGLARPSGGRVRIGDDDVTDWPPHRRQLGMVFQNYALFPHMSVFDNVAYGLRARRVPAPEVRRRVGQYLELVGLAEHAGKRPHQLSGGQQQRVALARALAIEARAVLFDEPLSNLDAKLRTDMQREIKRLHEDLGFTALYVTHDHEEALALSDRVCILDRGRIQQVGVPGEVFHEPANAFVARFFGYVNEVPGWIERDGAGWVCRLPDGRAIPIPRVVGARGSRGKGHLFFHPAQAFLQPASAGASEAVDPWSAEVTRCGPSVAKGQPGAAGRAVLHGVVRETRYYGVRWEAAVELPWGDQVLVSQPNSHGGPPSPGQRVMIELAHGGPVFFVDVGAGEEALEGANLAG